MKINKDTSSNVKESGWSVLSGQDLLKEYENYDDRSYRRGYHHGYEQALDDIKYEKNTDKFTEFDGKLMRWRYGRGYPTNEMIMPPDCED
jgi:hypothetical protein